MNATWKRYLRKNYYLLPTIFLLGAQTSMVAFIHVFITQWYSREEQLCLICEQFFVNDLSFHSSALRGQEPTTVAVAIDSLHAYVWKMRKISLFTLLQMTHLFRAFSYNRCRTTCILIICGSIERNTIDLHVHKMWSPRYILNIWFIFSIILPSPGHAIVITSIRFAL